MLKLIEVGEETYNAIPEWPESAKCLETRVFDLDTVVELIEKSGLE